MTTSSPTRAAAPQQQVRAIEPASPTQVQAELSVEDQQRLFQALDVLQKEKADAEQRTSSVLDEAAREQQMVDKLRQLRRAQGQEVDEAQLLAAVRATREPTNLVYEATPEGLGRNLANLYLARARWLPATIATLCIAIAVGGSVMGVSAVRERNFQSHIVAGKASLQEAVGARNTLAQLPSAWPQVLGRDVFQAKFDRTLGEVNQTLTQAGALLAAPTRENIDQVDALIDKANTLGADARAVDASLREQVQRVKWAQSPASQVNDPSWPEITTRAKVRRDALMAALATGDLQASNQEARAIQALSQASSVRSSLREAAALVPAVGQEEAQALRSRGEAALLNADIASASASLSGLRSLTDTINTSYTMKIVNEDGVKSGVWRYPNDNPTAKNYYVVVDALDASGNPVQVKVVNEETGKSEVVSRFAVRVSEAEYEKVKADKMDNGLIENALVGKKAAGKLVPEFNIDTAGGGIITEW